MLKHAHAFIAAFAPLMVNAIEPGTRILVEDVRVLMVSAIDAPSGEARGVLTGQIAKLITDRFRATGPILVDVSTERRYTQPGCSRLKLRFSQDGVNLPGVAAPQAKSVDIGLNYCRDGLPPKSLS